MREDFAASVRRDMIPLLVAAAEGKLTVRLLPEEGTGGQVLKVLEISGAGLPPVKLYVDSQSLVVRQSFQTPAPDGPCVGVPAAVRPVAFGASTRYAFHTTEPSAMRTAVMLPRNVQHSYAESFERVSSHDAAGTNATPSWSAKAPVRRVACARPA